MDKFINKLGIVVLFASGLCIGHSFGVREGRKDMLLKVFKEIVDQKVDVDDGK